MTKMNFNGQWIDNLYVDPHRGLGPGVENTTVKVGQSTGETFLHSTKNKRMIVVDYQIYGSTRRELELTLADKLYTDDVVPIIFSDKPNEVWYGKLDELPTMEKPGVSATGTFSLLVPDGLSHALTPTTATNMPYKDVPVNLLTGTGQDTVIDDTANTDTQGYKFHAFSLNQQPKVGDQITVSAEGTLTGRGDLSTYAARLYDYNITDPLSDSKRLTAGKRSSATLEVNNISGTGNTVLIIYAGKISGTAGKKNVIHHLKAEFGSVATPWSPNPADPEYYADTITLTNNGTVPTPVNIETEFDHDNGYFAASLDDRYYQIGHPDEIDVVDYKQNETLAHDSFNSDAELDNYTKNNALHRYNPSGTHQQGAFKTAVVGDDKRSVLQVSNTGPLVQGWQGPALTKTIPADSNGVLGVKNPALEVYLDFYATNNLQSGILEINLTDANDKFVAGVLFRKPAQGHKHIEVTFYAGDKAVWTSKNDARWDNFRGRVSIYKFNNHFWFGLSKLERGKDNHTVSFNYYDDTLKDLTATKYHIWASHWQDQKLIMIELFETKLVKQNVDKQANVANFFSPGDKLLINSEEYKTYINDVVDLDNVATGSKPLLLPANSTTTLALATSSFGHLRKVTATFRERWI